MKNSQDFKEFIGLLHDHEVKYLIVGGYAFAIHAEPRFTKDLDIFLKNEPANVSKVLLVLKDFGFESINLSEEDLLEDNKVIQLGFAPLRIDLLTGISGVDFDDAWKRKVVASYDSQKAFFISKEDLYKNKMATGRDSDRIDAEKLKPTD